MKHARSITTRSRFLVRLQKFPSTPIFQQFHTFPTNFTNTPTSRIAHFSVVSVTNTPSSHSL